MSCNSFSMWNLRGYKSHLIFKKIKYVIGSVEDMTIFFVVV